MNSKLRLVLLLWAICAAAQTSADGDQLVLRWNRFVVDANHLAQRLRDGLVDAKDPHYEHARAKLDKEWKAVRDCGCW